MMQDHYPRVLIVMMTKVKADDPGNLLIRAEFGDWPKDRLAQIHAAGETAGHGEFCGRYYQLQKEDRVLGKWFQKLRGQVFEMVKTDAVEDRAHFRQAGLHRRFWRWVKKCAGDLIIGSGIWELLFRVRISAAMQSFIDNFKPDVVYCQGYSLGFAALPLLISEKFKLPICFQTTDDWPSYAYKHFPMKWILRRKARQLIARAKVRLAFGKKMQCEFESRYGAPFEATYHLDNPLRFAKPSGLDAEAVRIVYTGNIALRRYEAIQDLLHVVRMLPQHERPIQIVIYCTGLPKDTPRELLEAPEVKFLPLPGHDDLPGVLTSASILFLPESFNATPEMIEYSLSSKVHIYMMSGRPILVYGPAYGGTVEYAVNEGWGLAVTARNTAKLKEALEEILGGARSQQMRRNAEECITRHHDLTAGRERFLKLIAAVWSDDTRNSVQT